MYMNLLIKALKLTKMQAKNDKGCDYILNFPSLLKMPMILEVTAQVAREAQERRRFIIGIISKASYQRDGKLTRWNSSARA